jgi:hypothetical protein
MATQYFSKWRNEWVDFYNQPPGEGELSEMRRFKYEIRETDENQE